MGSMGTREGTKKFLKLAFKIVVGMHETQESNPHQISVYRK